MGHANRVYSSEATDDDPHMQGNNESARGFYEGKWTEINYSSGSLRNYLVKKERFFIRELGHAQGSVLDLGCGGGWKFLTKLGDVAGLDLSHSSLVKANQIYSLAAQSDAIILPFPDESFDFVVSQDLIGHIPIEHKSQLLQEIQRVLKRGGKTVHYVETLSQDPQSRFARRYPDLYERHFVAPEGHIGLESPTVTFERFQEAGFVPVREIEVYKALIYIDRFIEYFDNEYKEKSGLIRMLVSFLKPLARFKPLTLAANLFVTLMFEVFDPILPKDWAGGVLVCYTKGNV